MKNKTLNKLKNDKWYHTTGLNEWKSIHNLGVQADYNKLNSIDLDFGYGFYMSDTQERAEIYGNKLVDAHLRLPNDIVILEFNFTPYIYFSGQDYTSKIFESYDDEFADFVFENRTKNDDGAAQHEYDIIYGVMSDSLPTKLISEYQIGRVTKDDVLVSLKKATSMKQLSLHNQCICDILCLERAYLFNTDTLERKELDINGYNDRRCIS